MQTSVSARTVEHGRLQIVEDDLPGTAAKELQGMDQRPVEVGLALRETEFDVAQAAVTQHGHEHRDAARGVADLDPPTAAPIDLHGLARFVEHLLIDAPPGRPDLPQVARAPARSRRGIPPVPCEISSSTRTAESSGYLAISASIFGL